MVKRTSLQTAGCPVARALDVIGDWWSLLIIRDAFDGVRRFGEFQEGLGIAKGMLATRLRDLTERGILETAPASDGSAYREYVLTEKGRGLFLVVVALRQWGEAHLYKPTEQRSTLVEAKSGAAVARLELRAKDGRVLSWAETKVQQPAAVSCGPKLRRPKAQRVRAPARSRVAR
ncbi:MAG: helix-turn-helix transcriptional regulator [Rhodopseudomonas palustris]|uniref:Helix-turn-helix transcriptional regulator n=1 Tax=Rhodopseudomonas palustris TaxID=1076 RepID=A0A933W396_RHOPL|nr:helix-turn-helix transcriptional regulator [Rhodopseudomonas palustris]